MQKWPRQIDGTGKLVRLHSDQTDKGPATRPADHPDDPSRPDTAIGLVVGVDADRHIGAEHLPSAGVFGETIEAGERVRGDRRLDPPDRVAVVVVMRRLDQHQVENRGVAHKRRCRRGSGQIERFRLSASPWGEISPLL